MSTWISIALTLFSLALVEMKVESGTPDGITMNICIHQPLTFPSDPFIVFFLLHI
ncbi:MAG: hypothetical protein RMJ00_06525 [Nitrososphaerota archaeon]|nr:hypothetical protein [Candidatus Bathyarchaeota archaeon]MCX8162259.1 hypothetical protein [Candidatus Bathyarchaeota archaeon]MDW8062335.1 hypothetical protein [Nitrososphaerota archaeon]